MRHVEAHSYVVGPRTKETRMPVANLLTVCGWVWGGGKERRRNIIVVDKFPDRDPHYACA